MISPLSPSELRTLHDLNRAAGVLLTMFRLKRFTGDAELAGLLDQHLSTVRGHLRSLDRLGLVVRTRFHQGYGLTYAGHCLALALDYLLQAAPQAGGDPAPQRPDDGLDAVPAAGPVARRDAGLDAGVSAGLNAGPDISQSVWSGAGQGAGPEDAGSDTGFDAWQTGEMERSNQTGDNEEINTGYAQPPSAATLPGIPPSPPPAASGRPPADPAQALAGLERAFTHPAAHPSSPPPADLAQALAGLERAFPHPAAHPSSPPPAASDPAPADLAQALASLCAPLAENGRSPAESCADDHPSTPTATTTATILFSILKAVAAAESRNGPPIPEWPAEAQPPTPDGERPGEQEIDAQAGSATDRRPAPRLRREQRAPRPSPAGGSPTASEEPLSPEAQANYAALRRYGVGFSHRVRQVCALEHVTPEYIHRQAERLRDEQRLKPGLLISVVAAGDPVVEPDANNRPRSSERDRQRYTEWEE